MEGVCFIGFIVFLILGLVVIMMNISERGDICSGLIMAMPCFLIGAIFFSVSLDPKSLDKILKGCCAVSTCITITLIAGVWVAFPKKLFFAKMNLTVILIE
ncbi:MAG: hypothetical protein J7J93_01295, partial [Candidatus Aenigmarchaeota archaeon]|nr:hypothetical protein [Candidatus Aenigmarchaeota archaeon]